jgi:hypothetical protein
MSINELGARNRKISLNILQMQFNKVLNCQSMVLPFYRTLIHCSGLQLAPVLHPDLGRSVMPPLRPQLRCYHDGKAMSCWFVGWAEKYMYCSRGVFELGQVEWYCYYWKGCFGLVGVERIANFPLPFYENISTVPAEI